jgi:fucose permease
MKLAYTYRHTLHACYTGYITQAIVNNLAPLLFVIFQNQYGLSYEKVGRLILINFGVQLIADLLSVRYVDRIGYRRAACLAHLLCIGGLLLLAALPNLLPDPYPGLVVAVAVYALGGGLLEVLVSPIVNALPGEEKESAMSLLHSFYCWGQVGVVLLTTLLLRVIGPQLWPVLPVVWCLVPLFNFFRFRKVPLTPPLPEERLMTVRELFRSRFFVIALLLMLCAGASELTMSQWSSLFAQKALLLPKVFGDLLGPCLFAVLMGIGRTIYGVWGSRIRLKPALIFCGALCLLCYAVTVFSPWPLLALAGCAFCGFSVSLMWPGTFSLSAARFPTGGTALFGMLAVFGDLGGSMGPWLTGIVSDRAQAAYAKLAPALPFAAGLSPSRFGLKMGLLAAAVFPILLLIGLLLFRNTKKEANS